MSQREDAIFWTIIAVCPGVLSLAFPKLAVVALLTKVLNPAKWHKWFLWFMGIVSVLTFFAVIGTLLGQCSPMDSQWDFSIEGTCVDKKYIANFSIYASGE